IRALRRHRAAVHRARFGLRLADYHRRGAQLSRCADLCRLAGLGEDAEERPSHPTRARAHRSPTTRAVLHRGGLERRPMTFTPLSLKSIVVKLGWPGKAAAVILVFTAAFQQAALAPLDARKAELDRSTRAIRQPQSSQAFFVRAASPSSKLATFYRFFEREES